MTALAGAASVCRLQRENVLETPVRCVRSRCRQPIWPAANASDNPATGAKHVEPKRRQDRRRHRRAGVQRAEKDLYEIGEIPPLGHVPKNMYAWAIRKERHGEPDTAMQVEVVPTWELDSHDVLVLVMAAGVNYNGVWAALGKPISPLRRAQEPLSHRRLGRVRHRLGGRLQGEALEGRRRGRHPLQPGRRRRRGVQRRRSDVLALASASGATRRRTAPSRSSAACRTASCWSARST